MAKVQKNRKTFPLPPFQDDAQRFREQIHPHCQSQSQLHAKGKPKEGEFEI